MPILGSIVLTDKKGTIEVKYIVLYILQKVPSDRNLEREVSRILPTIKNNTGSHHLCSLRMRKETTCLMIAVDRWYCHSWASEPLDEYMTLILCHTGTSTIDKDKAFYKFIY